MYTPTLAGFLTFIRTQMGIDTTALPDASPWIPLAFSVSMETVDQLLNQVSPLIYEQAVYFLGGDQLLNWAQDTPPSTYFADARKGYGINAFVAGVINTTHDETTGESITVPQWGEKLTLANLQNLKTPYGRQYLAWAQSTGTMWVLA